MPYSTTTVNQQGRGEKKWRYKCSMQFEGKENKKSVVSEGLLENTSSNQDEEKDRDEPVDAENDKELAGNGDKVGEEISKNYHLIVNGRALLHKVF